MKTITNTDEYEVALLAAFALIVKDPQPDSPEWAQLLRLVEQIETYELDKFPIAASRIHSGQFPPMWVISDHPEDFPLAFVVREFDGDTPLDARAFVTLDGARAAVRISGASVCFGRHKDDNPCILETWV